MKNLLLSIVVGTTSLLVAACGPSMLVNDGGITGAGGGSGSGNCGTVAACGGNIVGDWMILDNCIQFTGVSPLGSFCPTGTTDASGLNMTGNVSYLANGTYAAMVVTSGTMMMHLPASCLTMDGVTLTCAQLDAAVKQGQANDPDPSIQSISCSGSSACTCTIQMTPQTSDTTGTYVTQGTQLIEDGGDPIGYCVQNQELHLDVAAMGTGTGTSGGVVLRRR
jgi:hypothetical protein